MAMIFCLDVSLAISIRSSRVSSNRLQVILASLFCLLDEAVVVVLPTTSSIFSMTSLRSSTMANFFLLSDISVVAAAVSFIILVVSDFLVDSDGIDENTFDVCSLLETKLMEELVVSDFLVEFNGMDENSFDVCSALETTLMEELVAFRFLVESDGMDENTFDVCSALETKLVEELVVSDFLIESDGMDENTLYVCSALTTMLVEERIARVGDGWIETTSSGEE